MHVQQILISPTSKVKVSNHPHAAAFPTPDKSHICSNLASKWYLSATHLEFLIHCEMCLIVAIMLILYEGWNSFVVRMYGRTKSYLLDFQSGMKASGHPPKLNSGMVTCISLRSFSVAHAGYWGPSPKVSFPRSDREFIDYKARRKLVARTVLCIHDRNTNAFERRSNAVTEMQ